MQITIETKKFDSDGITISYTISGSGQPIIFMHGNLGSNEHFEEMNSLLSGYTVCVPDARSHGKSQKVKRLKFEEMADDVARLIRHENMVKPIFYGFSDGGIVGLILAAKYPDLLKELVVSGINISPKGIKPLWRFIVRFCFFFTRNDKFRLMIKQPNITADQLKQIKVPTLILYGEKDIVELQESEIAKENIPNSKLVIIPGENHVSYVLDNKKLFTILKDNTIIAI